jgi:NADH-quinone oxidoreductase subunit J
MLENGIFIVLSLFLIGGSIAMIRFRQSVFSAISFLLAMVALAGMFALLNQSFLFLAQILVSVGAVITLTLLVMVSINIKEENLPKDRISNKHLVLYIILILPIIALLFKAISSTNFVFKPIDEEFGTLKGVGIDLFNNWVLPFESISILLLTAMIGGIIISKRKFEHDA